MSKPSSAKRVPLRKSPTGRAREMNVPFAESPIHPAIPLETQTLYAELIERLRALEFERAFGHLSGSFGKKVKDGRTYWYFRTSAGGQGRAEFFVGPDNPIIRNLISRQGSARQAALEGKSAIARIASMLMVGGCVPMDAASARVVDALASGGIFRLGGVLVGTQAFLAMGNLLGVRWSSSTRTQDIDIGAFKTLEVAVPQAFTDVPGTLDSLQMGFLPTPGLDPRSPSTSYSIRGKSLRVDLLTTASRRGSHAPVYLPRFQAAALPLPFMDYLLVGSVDAVALSGGATLVKVPDPARFGFHKLLVAEARSVAEQGKVAKDTAQASQLLSLLLDMRPGDLDLALDGLKEKGLAKRVYISAKRFLKADSNVIGFLRDRFRA